METTDPQHDKTAVLTAFEEFRTDLDDYNDRRERLIKASRDITNISKKIIFLLHRIALEPDSARDDPKNTSYQRAAKSGFARLREVQTIYAHLAEKSEFAGSRFWRYQHQVSPGLQEYIEALSFAHFLQHGTLITFDAVQRSLSSPQGVPFFPLTVSDYLLGLSDLMGELMRFAISGLSARKNGRAKAREVCAFVRACRADFEQFTPSNYDLRKKQYVTSQSLEKIEDAIYAVVVRTSEYNLPPEIIDDIVNRTTSRYSDDPLPKKRRKDDLDDNQDDHDA